MTESFVKVPDRLRRDPRVFPEDLALWIHIRAWTHEDFSQRCFESGRSIDRAVRHRPHVDSGSNMPSAFKRSQRHLRDSGYLVSAPGPGTTRLRWAICPGEAGKRDLTYLVKKGWITKADARVALDRQHEWPPTNGSNATQVRGACDPEPGQETPMIQEEAELGKAEVVTQEMKCGMQDVEVHAERVNGQVVGSPGPQ